MSDSSYFVTLFELTHTVTIHVRTRYNGLLQEEGGGGGRVQGNLWYNPPAIMTSRLASVTVPIS